LVHIQPEAYFHLALFFGFEHISFSISAHKNQKTAEIERKGREN